MPTQTLYRSELGRRNPGVDGERKTNFRSTGEQVCRRGVDELKNEITKHSSGVLYLHRAYKHRVIGCM
jgi:hypothetical protein